jgi:hypothetical protein
MSEGDIDYIVPQLYWEIGKTVADYAVLADWWSKNAYNCNLYIGLSASNLNVAVADAWRTPNELCRQMRFNCDITRIDGVAFYSCMPLLKNPQGICDSLRTSFFRYPALIPIAKNISGTPSAQPDNIRIERFGARDYLMWNEVYEEGGNEVAYYVVYRFDGDEMPDISKPENIVCKTIDNSLDLSVFEFDDSQIFIVTSVNRFNYESESVGSVLYSLPEN